MVEENCKKGLYADKFSPDFQKEIKRCSGEIAVILTEDEEFVKNLDSDIEEAIRVMILRK